MRYLHPKRTASNGPSHRILALLALLTLLPMGTVSAMHHLAEEGQSDTQAQIATAERFIDAFYSFDAAKLAPLLEHASDSAPGMTDSKIPVYSPLALTWRAFCMVTRGPPGFRVLRI